MPIEDNLWQNVYIIVRDLIRLVGRGGLKGGWGGLGGDHGGDYHWVKCVTPN